MSRKIFDAFAEDVERLATVFPYDFSGDDQDLRRYLVAQYYDRLAPAVVEKIFRSLWRVVFKSEDARCETNREINGRALRILYERHSARLFETIAAEPDWFSGTALKGKPVRALIAFLADYPKVYALLKDPPKVLIAQHVANDLDQIAVASFLAPSFGAHLRNVREKVTRYASMEPATFERLAKRAKEEDELPALYDLAITMYGSAWSYDDADKRFKAMIAPHLESLTGDQLVTLLTLIEENSQTYSRGRAKDDHPKVKIACDVILGPSFDFSAFPKFMASFPAVPPAVPPVSAPSATLPVAPSGGEG